jgi:hypothetical protein
VIADPQLQLAEVELIDADDVQLARSDVTAGWGRRRGRRRS